MLRSNWRYELGKVFLRNSDAMAPLSQIKPVGEYIHKEFFGPGNTGRVIPVNQSVDNVEDVVLPSQIVRRLIEKSGRRVLMDKCICRAAGSCESYPADLGCIFMGQASRKISRGLGKPVSVDRALDHLDKCEAAGLVHLVGRFKFDAILLNATPHHKLLSICNCCECCCVFKNIPDLYAPIGETLKKLEGVEVTVGDECKGCGLCAGSCFVRAITLDGDRAVISDACKGCGRCVTKCPTGSIKLTIENSELVENTIKQFEDIVG
ncbi:DUF362 domain-containing protein [bacterium]